MHDEQRRQLLRSLDHAGKVSELLSSKKRKVVENLAHFLVKIEDQRRKIEKDEREKED